MDGQEAVQGAREAQQLLVSVLEQGGFNDDMARGPSKLPGWSRGHLLTHIARNGDSFRRMIDAAVAGDIVLQYPGGSEQREGDIESGSARSARDLLDDLRESGEALSAAFDRVDGETWNRTARRFRDQPWPVFDLPFLRWREVAIHSVDVGLDSLTIDGWSQSYVERELLRQVAGLGPRLPGRQGLFIAPSDTEWSVPVLSMEGDEPRPFVVVDALARSVLAWLVGRHDGEPEWPSLRPWQGIP